jgi:flagellar export protein FliJ
MTTQLTTLIRLRQYEVDRGRTQLAIFTQQESLLAERLVGLDQQAELHRSQLSVLSRCGQLNIDAIRLRQQYLQLLSSQRDQLLADVQAARLATAQCRERLIAADQRLQVAEKLRERALREGQLRFERQETQSNDDVWQLLSHPASADIPPA